MLLGSYRRGDANDPDIYVASIAAVLAMFEPDVIREATDPRTGIQSRPKFAAFMPNSGEVKEFCEHLLSERAKYARYRALPPPEVVSRKYIPPDPPPGPNGKHPVGTILSNYEEAFKQYGRPIGRFEQGREQRPAMAEFYAEMESRGLHFNSRPASHNETPATVMAKLGLTQEQWDELPDGPHSNWQKARI